MQEQLSKNRVIIELDPKVSGGISSSSSSSSSSRSSSNRKAFTPTCDSAL